MQDANNKNIKKLGIGSLSMILSIFSIIISFTYIGGEYIGKHLLNFINVSFPTSIISITLFLISIYIGNKYQDDYGAKFGKNVSKIFLIIIITLGITSSLYSYF